MTKHYVLSINPHAQYDWDQCILRNPITGEHPDFTAMIAQAVGNEPGSYLVAVNVEVKVLEKAPVPQSEEVALDLPKGTKAITAVKPKTLVAS
ncbi:MAG: hypothetical protein AB4426_28445 [Xenococcaceae cyanobacterium]